jgi:hypothetical protein
MKSKPVKIKSNRVYLERKLRPERSETAENGYYFGRPPGPDLADKELESHEHRQHFQRGDGDISIVVEAGDELGKINVCLQYEGKIADYSGCIARQNDLIRDAGGWLAEILAEFETGWEADIVSVPCPKADEALEVRAAIDRLRGVETKVRTAANVSSSVKTKVDI